MTPKMVFPEKIEGCNFCFLMFFEGAQGAQGCAGAQVQGCAGVRREGRMRRV